MLGNIHRRQHAGRIAGVNAGFFDVLHDAADDHVFAVRKRVHVHFDRVFEEVIDQHRPVLRILDRFLHVADDHLFVVGDHHGASAEHIRRPHQHRISNSVRALDRFFHRSRHRARGLRNFQFVQQFAEALAVFRQIDRLGRRADDVHARRLQRQRQIQRRLSAELHDHAHRRSARSFVLADGKHVFQGQRLEVEAIAGVVVGRDRLRIAVDHDGLVTIVAQRKRRVAAAVVKLNSLPDAVGPAAQNDDFLLLGRRGLVFFFVGRVQIRRVAFEFRGAGVHALVDRRDAVLLAQMPNFFLRALAVEPPDPGQPPVGEAHALGLAQHLGGNRFHGMLFQLQLHVVNLFELVQEPGIDRRHLRQLLDGVALAQRITNVGKPLGMRRHQPLGQNLGLNLLRPRSSCRYRARARP